MLFLTNNPTTLLSVLYIGYYLCFLDRLDPFSQAMDSQGLDSGTPSSSSSVPLVRVVKLCDSPYSSSFVGIGPSTSRPCNVAWDMNTSWSVQEEEAAPVLGLNLELGRGNNSDQKLGCTSIKCSGFTFFQLQELQLQALIYKYLEAGLPVPYHLLLPIWKSFASSLGILNGGLFPGEKIYSYSYF